MTIKERNELVIKYIPLAKKIARKFSNLEEVQSAAYYGLIDAANKYNSVYKSSFSSYAKIRISGEIKDYLRKNKQNHQELKDDYSLDHQDYTNLDLFAYVFSFLDCTGQKIIRMYYIEDRSMKEIGEQLDIGESRVSQLLSKYKKIIRKKL